MTYDHWKTTEPDLNANEPYPEDEPMRTSDAFPSKFLSASDLKGRSAVVTIDRYEMDTMRDGRQKPVLYFKGKVKGLVLNKTNANNIGKSDQTFQCGLGEEMDNWLGQQIELFPALVDFQGDTVEGIRVRKPRSNGILRAAPPPPPAEPTHIRQTDEELDDAIPF